MIDILLRAVFYSSFGVAIGAGIAFGLWLTDTIEYKLMGARSLRKK